MKTLRTKSLNDQGMVPDFRQLTDAYQIHHHFKCCRLPNATGRFGYPQEMVGHTRIRGHNYHFARDAEEGNIVPHNPSLLASFRAHHCLKVIHSDSVSDMFSSIVQRILMLDGYHSRMSFMRAIPSLELINCSSMLQLVFHPPQNASLAFVDIGDTT
jgi:hypothetical protein